MHRTSSFKRSRSLTQRESLCVLSFLQFFFISDSLLRRGIITLERKLLAHLDLQILIPHTLIQKTRAPRHHHSNCLSLPLLHHFLLSLVPHKQEQSQVLVLPLVDGALILWACFAACPFRTQIINHSFGSGLTKPPSVPFPCLSINGS